MLKINHLWIKLKIQEKVNSDHRQIVIHILLRMNQKFNHSTSSFDSNLKILNSSQIKKLDRCQAQYSNNDVQLKSIHPKKKFKIIFSWKQESIHTNVERNEDAIHSFLIQQIDKERKVLNNQRYNGLVWYNKTQIGYW
jgi:hypothetical protein